MRLIDIIRMAIHNLRRRPHRTALNLFGIVLGIVIILMTTAGTAGVKQSLRSLLENSEFTRKVIALRSSQINESDLNKSDWTIHKPMSDVRQSRMEETLKKHVLSEKRRKFGRFRNIDTQALERFESIANTLDVVPLMRLQFDFSYGEFNQVVFGEGVSPQEVGLPDRIVAGNMLGSNDLDGILIHELLAYQMGFVTKSELDSLVGAEITAGFHSKGKVNDIALLLTSMAGGDSRQLMQHQAEFLTAMKTLVGNVDESSLAEDQKKLIQSIFKTVVEQEPDQERMVSRKFKIKGVYYSSKNTDMMRYLQRFTFNSAQPVLFHHKTATDVQVNIQNKKNFYSATLFVDGYKNLEQVEDDVAAIGFETSSARKMLAVIDERIDEISRVIYLVALLILLITAIVISNTLIISVMERTTEFGIMKSLGARDKHVVLLMLVEGALLGASGAIIAIFVSLALSKFGHEFIQQFVEGRVHHTLPAVLISFSTWSVLLGIGAATLACGLASIIPAWRAARLDPVIAMQRH